MEYCYCVVFDNGVLKFGRTENIHSRLSSHISNASIHGATCTAVVLGSTMDSKVLERAIVAQANKALDKHHGNEYYLGDCDDAVAVMVLAGMTPTVATPTKDGSSLNFLVSRTAQVAARYKITTQAENTDSLKGAILRVLQSGPKTGGVMVSRLRKYEREVVEGALVTLSEQCIIQADLSVHPRNGKTVETYSLPELFL